MAAAKPSRKASARPKASKTKASPKAKSGAKPSPARAKKAKSEADVTAKLIGEKAVRRTDKTLPVAAKHKPSRAARAPLGEAIDRREHFPEADALRGGPKVRGKTGGGGSSNRTKPVIPLSE